MNYKEKYLKYKLKYLNLKKMHGGMFSNSTDNISTYLLFVANQEIFKNSYKEYLKNMQINDFLCYIDLFDTQYFSGTLGYFNDNVSLNKQQYRLLEYINENDINELKKKILEDNRRFKDITRLILSQQNQEISNTEITTYMDGNTSDIENQDPNNPDLL